MHLCRKLLHQEAVYCMSGYKYFIKNIGLLTLSQFATKLLSFFLVPLYTNILTTSEFGTFDLFSATISVLVPVLSLNIQDSVLRFSLDKKMDENAIVTVGTKYFSLSNLLILVFLILNRIFNFSLILNEYALLFWLIFFSQSLAGLMSAYIRGIDRVADLSLSSVIASAITIGSNILFLVVFKWGLRGYFIANIIGPLVQSVYLLIRSRYLGKLKFASYKNETREMLTYSRPLIANNIAWWVNNVSDRYVVTFFCGLAENGIYSVAGKIPQILNIIQTIVNQAWTLSAIKDYDPDDKKGFFSNTYSAYNCLMVVMCSGIIVFNKLLARILYAKDYYIAWKYVPWLTIAIVFGALSGYLGGFFSAVRDSKVFATSTVYGAVINVMLNFIFTPIFGALGAAVATAISFLVVWAFRFFYSRKYIKLRVNVVRHIVSYMMLVAQAVFMLIISGTLLYMLELAVFIIILLLYIPDLKKVVLKIVKRN